MKDSADLPRFEHLTLGANTPDECHRVALHAVLAADTIDGRRHLLNILGLHPAPTAVANNPINTTRKEAN